MPSRLGLSLEMTFFTMPQTSVALWWRFQTVPFTGRTKVTFERWPRAPSGVATLPPRAASPSSSKAEAARARLRNYEGNNPTLELHELSTALPQLSTTPPRLSLRALPALRASMLTQVELRSAFAAQVASLQLLLVPTLVQILLLGSMHRVLAL